MREALLGVAVGKKGVGKTFTTDLMIKSYIRGNPSQGIPPRRVLILDVNDEFGEVKSLSIKDIVRFSQHPMVEVRRIRPFNEENGQRMTLNQIAEVLFLILLEFKGGLLLIEDINKYVSDNLPNDLIGAICTQRHMDLDIIMHYQSIGRIPPKVWQNVNWIRFHKNTDSVRRHKDKFEDKFEFLSLVENMVNTEYNNGNKRFYAYINVEEMKMLPGFDREKFEAATQEYIDANYAQLIAPKLKERNNDGENKFTVLTARQFHFNRMMNEYTVEGAGDKKTMQEAPAKTDLKSDSVIPPAPAKRTYKKREAANS